MVELGTVPRLGVAPGNADQAVRILHGQWSQGDVVEGNEQCHVDADTEGQRDYRGERERRRLHERPRRVAEVLEQLLGPQAPLLVARLLGELRHAAELAQRRTARFVR